MNPTDITAAARQLLAAPNRKLGASRLLAGAILIRQALEDALDQLWAGTVPQMQEVSGRVQLISLPFYIDPRLGGDVTFAWCRLSAACHHDAYELPPSAKELERLADIVDELAARSDESPITAAGGAS